MLRTPAAELFVEAFGSPPCMYARLMRDRTVARGPLTRGPKPLVAAQRALCVVVLSVIVAACTAQTGATGEASATGATSATGEATEPGATRATAPAEEGSADAPLVDAPVPARIVSLIPAATEMLFAIGAGPDLVGRTIHCDYPPEVAEIPSVGSGLSPDLERLLRLRPTVVVGSQLQEGSTTVQALVDAGVSVVLVPDQSLEDIAAALALLGRTLGRLGSAQQVVAQMERSLLATQERGASEERPRVLIAIDRDPLFAAGGDSFIGEVATIAGGENVLPGDWVQLDAEVLAQLAPNIIVEGDNTPEDGFWEQFSEVEALRDARYCRIPGDVMARPGPRLTLAADALVRCFAGRSESPQR
jgi:iron complex transport system substrate-binding protein